MNAANRRFVKQLLAILWKSRRDLPSAWKVLHGLCDDCSLGALGLRDPLGAAHLCSGTLNAAQSHMMSALDSALLREPEPLQTLPSEQLRRLGRLAYPMIRTNGARAFVRLGWAEAFKITSDAIRQIAPHEIGFLAAAHGLTNEAYYVFQKLARVLGTNNLGLCAAPRDAGCLRALHETLGVGAGTCSLADLIDTDLLVIFGSDAGSVEASLPPAVELAKKRGTRIVAINDATSYGPTRRSAAALRRESVDDTFLLRPRGAVPFVNGVIKMLIGWDAIDHEFIQRHTSGFERLAAGLAEQSWPMLEQHSGALRLEIQRFAARYRTVRSAAFVYCMEPLQRDAAGDMKAVLNLALARGMLGRDKCGVLPILSQSGVQGATDCGVAADRFPGGLPIDDVSARRFSNLWYHPVPSNRGLSIPELIQAAQRGRIKFLYCIGPHLLRTAPHARALAGALTRVPLRIHQDSALNKLSLLDSPGTVLILPAQTRYEQPGGGTMTSTDRRIVFAPEISRRAVGESLPDWEIPALIGRRSMPNGEFLFPFSQSRNIRVEMARVMPIYGGIERLNDCGDQLQWGGPQLCKEGRFRGMPGERALFSVFNAPGAGSAEAAAD